MREIKFRQAIFHPVTGEFLKWHYWGLIDGAFVGIDTGWVSPAKAIENSQQFVNLPDKNGKEIYEGDLFWRDWRGEPILRVVEFFNGGFVARDAVDHIIPMEYLGDFPLKTQVEVIGNIYENGDLLNGK